jgi:hypothetical protein
MPHVHVDQDVIASMGEEALGDHEGFEPAEDVTYVWAKAPGEVRAVRDALLAKGITGILCKYEGGGDEGFAYFQAGIAENSRFDLAELKSLLKGLVHHEAGHKHDPNLPPEFVAGLIEHDRTLSDEDRVAYHLENLAESTASALLGEGYGTGEYTMYGWFHVELNTGHIRDLEFEM